MVPPPLATSKTSSIVSATHEVSNEPAKEMKEDDGDLEGEARRDDRRSHLNAPPSLIAQAPKHSPSRHKKEARPNQQGESMRQV